jgi:MoCo/4Fe-4S cofactor protein with predicted Tat translocation signal
MSVHDQCPSTTGKGGKPAKPGRSDLARRTRALPALAGAPGSPKMWRSLDECADAPEFRDWLEREFPAGASELEQAEATDRSLGAAAGKPGDSRRDFLKVMGASIALAGAATIPGCRRPDHKILAYSKDVPEDVIPGQPLFYATSMPLPGGGAEGLLVETHEGRPTKVEGNPLHPVSRGKSSLWAQACVLGMYDPDRLKYPMFANPGRGRLEATWDDFARWSSEHFRAFDASKGDGLAFLVDKKTSPSRDAARDAILKRWPSATWVAYNAVENESAILGTKIALGAPMREIYSLDKASVIFSLDRDFVCGSGEQEPGALANARGFAATRRVMGINQPMSRLYVVEPGWSLAGSCADHRLRLAPSQIPAVALALAKAILAAIPGKAPALQSAVDGATLPVGVDAAWINAAAEDIVQAGSGAVILAGASQPPEVHAIVHTLNAVLGVIGTTVSYLPMGAEEATPSSAALAGLTARMDAGQIQTLVVVDANPLHNAPADLGFAAAFAKVATTVCLSVDNSETASACTWSLNGAHVLESWGDVEAVDGTISPIQPMIAPLYDGLSEIEFLSLLSAGPGADDAGNWKRPDGFALLQSLWKARLGAGFDKAWRRALHDGVFTGQTPEPKRPTPVFGGAAGAVAALKVGSPPGGNTLDVVFATGHLHDGRFANLGWLQELPQAGSRVVWDNPALLSPATAARLGIAPHAYTESDPNTVYTKGRFPYGRMVKVTVGGRSLEMAAWIMPGMADDTVILPLGYGRTSCGLVGDGVGFNTFSLRDSRSLHTAQAASVAPASGEHMVVSTQTHWALDGRTSVLRQINLEAWNKHGEEVWSHDDPLYGTTKSLNMAERLGELAHASPNISIYENPLNQSKAGPAPGSAFSSRPQWGMTIDLSTCTGCGVCTVACQSENNIPIVGKKETAKGREMTWIRVDRYFTGDENNPDSMLHQPVACVHCENAPCETVCPVNATTHGPEGMNYMVYNRCIGTRYCANNCPYKVRRFNFFDYGVTKVNGHYYGEEQIPGGGPENKNLIPPRLREKLDQITRLSKNPDVTVRSRGVMEKCTYCIQRVNQARIECKLHDIRGGAGENIVPDGFMQTACQQACPSDSIVFGDLLDPESRVRKTRNHGRSYLLLGFLNTRPRTSHMVAVRNPNPKIRPSVDPFAGDHGGHGGDDGHGAGDDGHSHTFFDGRKSASDRGYAMSLRVVNPVADGAMA